MTTVCLWNVYIQWQNAMMDSMKAALRDIESDSDSGFSSISPASDRSQSPTDEDYVSNEIVEEHSEKQETDEDTDNIVNNKEATSCDHISTESAEKLNLDTVTDSKDDCTSSYNGTDGNSESHDIAYEPRSTTILEVKEDYLYKNVSRIGEKDESHGRDCNDCVSQIREEWRRMNPVVWNYLQKLTIDHCVSKDEGVQKTEDVHVIPTSVFVELLQYAKAWNDHIRQGLEPPIPTCQHMQKIPQVVVNFFVKIMYLRYGKLKESPTIDNKHMTRTFTLA